MNGHSERASGERTAAMEPAVPKNQPKIATLALFGLAAGLSLIFGEIGTTKSLQEHVPEFVALILLAGILYLIGCYLVERFSLGWIALSVILLSSVGFRLFLLPADPAISDDVYRYQWDGAVQRAHLNPYEVYPAMRELKPLENPQHPLTAGTVTPTVYPPLSELLFRRLRSVPQIKVTFTLLDLGSIGVLLGLLAHTGMKLHRVLLYAWNPAVVVSFALSGHVDSLAIFALLLGFLFLARNWPRLSLGWLTLSVLAKFFTLVLLPVFLRKAGVLRAWVFGLVAMVLYLPFLSSGTHLFTGLSNFSKDWENNDSAFRLIRLWVSSKQTAEIVAGGVVLLLLAYVLAAGTPALRAGLIVTGGILLVSPNAFPWYFTWMVPYLCFYPKPSWLLMSVTSVLGYAPVVPYAAGQPFRDSPLLLALEYLPVFGLVGYEIARSKPFTTKRTAEDAEWVLA
ncbi:MAG: hypothetical protein JSS69_18160 [Acidobacteria bacterium]|nr:hypothetical protein [Acidobacteriota bacterium]MBS1867840.1 hypothetical protein [Acidobacteriota bacterium]